MTSYHKREDVKKKFADCSMSAGKSSTKNVKKNVTSLKNSPFKLQNKNSDWKTFACNPNCLTSVRKSQILMKKNSFCFIHKICLATSLSLSRKTEFCILNGKKRNRANLLVK